MSAVRTVALSLCVAAAWSAALHAQVHELKVSLFTPAPTDVNRQFDGMAKALEAKSGGALRLKLFHASQLGPAPRQFDLVRAGVADMAYVLHGLTPGRFPLTELVELPALAPSGYAASMALMDLLPQYLAAEHRGVRVMGFIVAPSLPTFTAKVEIRSLSHLKGLRIRHPGPVHAATLAALGATPLGIPTGEVHDALFRGTVDGALFGYTAAAPYKLAEVAKYASEMNLGVVTFAAVMNPGAYDRLPPALKRLIDEFAGPSGQPAWGKLFDVAEARTREVVTRAGVKVSRLDAGAESELRELAARLHEAALADLEKRGLPARPYFSKLKQALATHGSPK